MKQIGVVLSLLFLASVQGIFVKVGSHDICYLVKLEVREATKITFQVSGEDENNFQISVRDSLTRELRKEIKNQNEGIINIHSSDEFQSLFLCFKTTDSIVKLVSLEVYKFHEANPDSEFLSQDNIIQTEKRFREAEDYLLNLYTNFRHQSIREKTHREVMRDTEQKINICSVIKLLVVLIVITLQIVITTNQFKDKNIKPEFEMI